MTTDEEILRWCDLVRQTCFEIHVYFGPGFLEKVYQKAPAHRLVKAGFRVAEQAPVTVRDQDGAILGEYFADLIVNECLIVEIKTCKSLQNEHVAQMHVAQIFGYLRASDMRHGLLVNFGAAKLQIRKFVFNPRPS
jgi:GxxExxY protein